MKFFEDYYLLLLVFLIFPLLLAVGGAYFSTIRNYGSIIKKPPWKKTVESIVGVMFFGFVLGIYIHNYILSRAYKSIILIFTSFIVTIVLIFLSRFMPAVKEEVKRTVKKVAEEVVEKAAEKAIEKEVKKELKKWFNVDPANQSYTKRREKNPSPEETASYINIVLTVFSRFVFAGFIICSLFLRIILLKFDSFNHASIERTLRYWDIAAIGISIISTSVYLHTIYTSLTNPSAIPDNTQLSNVKDRLAE